MLCTVCAYWTIEGKSFFFPILRFDRSSRSKYLAGAMAGIALDWKPVLHIFSVLSGDVPASTQFTSKGVASSNLFSEISRYDRTEGAHLPKASNTVASPVGPRLSCEMLRVAKADADVCARYLT